MTEMGHSRLKTIMLNYGQCWTISNKSCLCKGLNMQAVQNQIRLLPEDYADQGLHYEHLYIKIGLLKFEMTTDF